MPWTAFLDIDEPEFPYAQVYIEAPREEAIKYFHEHFGCNPIGLACPQCNFQYLIEEYESLGDALEDFVAYTDESVEEYVKKSNVFFLHKGQIKKTTTESIKIPVHFHECFDTCSVQDQNDRIIEFKNILENIVGGIERSELSLDQIQQLAQKGFDSI